MAIVIAWIAIVVLMLAINNIIVSHSGQYYSIDSSISIKFLIFLYLFYYYGFYS